MPNFASILSMLRSSVLFVCFMLSGILHGQSKLALVIGNGEYAYLESLNNAVNDGNDMAEALESIGFDVMRHTDLNREQLKQAIKDFGQKSRDYDVLLFYFAGHGIELLGKNYFVPIDAVASSAAEVKRTCVSANAITHYMKLSRSSTNIVILDACRANPFTMLSAADSHDGLALMDAPTGTIISFATAPGRVAWDGGGRNGVFTEALLKYLLSYDLEIKDMFEKVRGDVVEKTQSKQIPWESTSLTKEVVLRRRPELPIRLNILEGDSVIFEGRGELHATCNLKGVAFSWYHDGRQFSNAVNPEVLKSGKYQVKGISREGQVLLSDPTYVTIKSFVDPQPYILEGTAVTFNGQGVLHGKSNVRGDFTWIKDNNYIGDGAEMPVDLPGNYNFVVKTSEGIIATSPSIRVRIVDR